MAYLTDEQRMIQETAREFAMKEVLPLADRLDPEQGIMPMALRDRMAELGFFGITIPVEYGGLGLGYFEYCLVVEELARAWMSVASILARGNFMLDMPLLSEEKRRSQYERTARGDFLRSGALSEPAAGSDVANISCRAVRDGDDWVITGQKMWCTFADGADFIQVAARTDPNVDPEHRHRGISAFMVEKPRGQLPENCEGHPVSKIGYHGWKTWELSFDQCRVPAEYMVGREGRAFSMSLERLVRSRANTSARAIGLARGGLEDAIAYAQQRVQFGKPIADFQAIRFMIAEMAANIEAARQLLYHVCGKIDAGERCDKEAAMAKWFASEMAERATSDALQIHGGAGYTTDFRVERYWRDARLTKIFEGTSQIQLRIISDRLLGQEGRT